ncbi:MAG: mannose-1-phosphate guanylyltransferase [Candidatus Omnitrophica bacterium]|nr:mannose-1-phosphate guanylyltransferase [Candidatus Omnitrophota bacterium]
MMHVVILAGGWGRRFWPKSRRNSPKQILKLGTRRSALQDLFDTVALMVPKQRIWLVANQAYAGKVRQHLRQLPRKNLLLEPLAKNTAAAIGLAMISIQKVDPQAVCVVLPSDNVVLGEGRDFLRAIKTGSKQAATQGGLVLLGIRPNRPAPEFGHIKLEQKLKGKSIKICKVKKFVEKPDFKKAKSCYKNKQYLWNAGIFIGQVDNLLKAIKKYMPKLHVGLERIAAVQGKSGYKSRLIKEYKRFKNISFDYGVMEKASNVQVVVTNFSWVDIGSWAHLPAKIVGRDSQGNVVCGLSKNIDTSNSVIFGEDEHLIATLGLRDVIVVQTPSATLVCKKDKAQQVKALTEILEKDHKLKKFL